jgi:hypothetical protein
VIDDPGLSMSTDARRRQDERADHPPTVRIAADSTTRDTPTQPAVSSTDRTVLDPTPHRAISGRRRRRRRLAVVVVVVFAVVLVPIVVSYVSALTGPGTDSVSERSVEWMRDHHLGGIVDAVERNWYNHHQAKVGGTPNVATAAPRLAARAAPTGTTSATANAPATATPATASPPTAPTAPAAGTAPAVSAAAPDAATQALPAPTAVPSPAATPVAGEGQWRPIDQAAAGRPGMFATLIRPDAVHTSVLDAVVWIDPHVVRLRQYPGAKLPGSPWDRPDHIAPADQPSLIAAFNGGARLVDSRGGMILGGQQIAPMRDGAATLMIDPNGIPTIGQWGRDIHAGQPMDSARQNLDLIVDAGAPVPNLLTDPNRRWGFTGPANKSAVWRSGAGITADGALIWVGGPGLTVETLAETLVRAGAVRGMQLDINQDWVQLNTYTTGSDGQVSGTKMLSGMRHTGNRWLTDDSRDFIAVLARNN